MNFGDEVVYISTIQIHDLIQGCDFYFWMAWVNEQFIPAQRETGVT